MSTLHILATANRSQLQRCLSLLGKQDGLLLLGDGVVHAGGDWQALGCPTRNLYCLAEDLQARALSERCGSAFRAISMSEFVRLTVEYSGSVSWGPDK